MKCGYNELFALDFDHIDPTTKSESICSLSRRVVPYSRIEAEISKCQVVCANCHRRRHHRDQEWHRVLTTANLTSDRKYKAKNVLKLLGLLSQSQCQKCGETDPVVLEFDHLDPTAKLDSVANLVCVSRGWAKIQREIDKCQILCANCHRLRTATQTRPSVYVGSSLFNTSRVSEVIRKFEVEGVPITYKWHKHGQIFDDETLAKVGEDEERGVRECTLFFMVHPARNGTHCELGMARVLDKHIVILEEGPPHEKKTFYYRPEGHQRPIHRFVDADQAVDFALQLLRSYA